MARWAGPGWRVGGVRRLRGGITSAVHRVALVRGDDRRHVVLRRFLWDTRDASAWAVRTEATVLRTVAPAVPVPPVLIEAPDGLVDGSAPALVLERAPGRVDLTPADPDRWLDELVGMLVRIHDLDVDGPTPFRRWTRTDTFVVPRGATKPDIWRRAFAILQDEPAVTERSFIHRDYQHFNLLWRRGRITSVLDWNAATNGPPAIDVGHCRLNLAVLYSAEMADDFLRRYEAEVGTEVDPWWDLDELCGFGDGWPTFIPLQVAGRAPVDVPGIPARVEATIAAALRRL